MPVHVATYIAIHYDSPIPIGLWLQHSQKWSGDSIYQYQKHCGTPETNEYSNLIELWVTLVN